MKLVYLAFAFVALATPFVVSPLQAQPVAPLRKSETLTISIVGQVRNPGTYTVKLADKITFLDLIRSAGGPTEEAGLREVKVYRGTAAFTVNVLDLLKIKTVDFALRDGDSVIVPRNENRVLVMGAVKKPGYYAMPEGRALSVADALALAGGGETAETEIRLIRGKLLPLKAGETTAPQVVKEVVFDQLLQNGDVVYVAEARRLQKPPQPYIPNYDPHFDFYYPANLPEQK